MTITYEDFKKVKKKLENLDVKKNERDFTIINPEGSHALCAGLNQSSAQISHFYNSENLVGKQVIGVCNFPEKNIAGVVSQVLILGAIEKDGKVVLVQPSQKTENGLDIA